MTLRDLNIFITTLQSLSDFDKLALLALDLSLSLFVGLLLSLKTAKVLLMLVLLAFEPALSITVLHTSLVNKFITTATVFNGVLPLQVKFVSLLMQPFEFLGSLV